MKKSSLKIHSLTKPKKSDWQKIAEILEHAFQKKLKISLPIKNVVKVFYAENHNGVAIVTNFHGKNYLDKLAVMPESRGLGLGKALLANVLEEFPQLVWRASHTNPYINFYEKQCDGSLKAEKWELFWKGYDLQEIQAVAQFILKKPADF